MSAKPKAFCSSLKWAEARRAIIFWLFSDKIHYTEECNYSTLQVALKQPQQNFYHVKCNMHWLYYYLEKYRLTEYCNS